jgi:RES domain-containing protein
LTDLPDGWPDGDPTIAASRGTEWAKSLRTPVLQVPAAAIRGEHNYILNPAHPDFVKIVFRILSKDPVDNRLRKKRRAELFFD